MKMARLVRSQKRVKIGGAVTHKGRNEDKQGVSIETKQLDKSRWCREVFEDRIQTKGNDDDIAIKQTSGPSHQVDVIIPLLLLQLVCHIRDKCAN